MEKVLKRQVGKIIVFCIFAVFFSFIMIRVYQQKVADEALKKADLECVKLANDLEKEDKTCSCWHSNCKTESEYVNQRTKDYCLCKCLENNTIVSVCLRRAL